MRERLRVYRHSLSCHPIRRTMVLFALYCLLGGGLYVNSLQNGFHYDDQYVIVANDGLSNPSHFLDLFTSMDQAGSDALHRAHYRPVVYASYMLNYAIGGLDPVVYHLTNLLIHIVTSVLIVYILEALLYNFEVGFLAGLLFLIHPFHAEAVNYATARSSLLYAMFYLASFYCYLRYHPPYRSAGIMAPVHDGSPRTAGAYLGLSLTFFILSMLSKEMAVMLPVTLVLYEWAFRARDGMKDLVKRSWIPIGYALLVILPYLQIRETLVRPTPIRDDGGHLLSSILTQMVVLFRTIGLIVFPFPLTIDHPVTAYTTFWSGPVAVAVLLLIGILGAAYYGFRSGDRDKRGWAFLGIWFFVVMLPLVVIPLKAGLQENRAYLASVGPVGLMAFGYMALSQWTKRGSAIGGRVLQGILILWVLTCAILVVQRNGVWKDDLSLWTDAVAKNPGSSEAHLGLGSAYQDRKELVHAAAEYREALIVRPDEYRALGNLAQIYRNQGQYEMALEAYQNLVALVPQETQAYQGLGITYQMTGKLNEAMAAFKRAVALDPTRPESLYRLGSVDIALGRDDDAIEVFKRLVLVRPDEPEWLNVLGVLLTNRGQYGDALPLFRKAVAMRPGDEQYQRNLALTLDKLPKGH